MAAGGFGNTSVVVVDAGVHVVHDVACQPALALEQVTRELMRLKQRGGKDVSDAGRAERRAHLSELLAIEQEHKAQKLEVKVTLGRRGRLGRLRRRLGRRRAINGHLVVALGWRVGSRRRHVDVHFVVGMGDHTKQKHPEIGVQYELLHRLAQRVGRKTSARLWQRAENTQQEASLIRRGRLFNERQVIPQLYENGVPSILSADPVRSN